MFPELLFIILIFVFIATSIHVNLLNQYIYYKIIIHISLSHINNLCYLSIHSSLLNIGLNRLGTICFSNSLIYILVQVFIISIISILLLLIYYYIILYGLFLYTIININI